MRGFTIAARRVGSFGALLIGLAALSGCSSAERKTAAAPLPPPPPATVSQIRSELVKSKVQVEATNKSLDELMKSTPADSKDKYTQFQADRIRLGKAADATRGLTDDLQARAEEYRDTWSKQAQVENPQLQRRAAEQRERANQAYSTIKAKTELLKISFGPYETALKDIDSYLSTNLSPAAIASVSDLASKAMADGKEINSNLDALIGELNKVMEDTGEAGAVSSTR